jgi:hypothetical protein
MRFTLSTIILTLAMSGLAVPAPPTAEQCRIVALGEATAVCNFYDLYIQFPWLSWKKAELAFIGRGNAIVRTSPSMLQMSMF